jgi:hypothetical protein
MNPTLLSQKSLRNILLIIEMQARIEGIPIGEVAHVSADVPPNVIHGEYLDQQLMQIGLGAAYGAGRKLHVMFVKEECTRGRTMICRVTIQFRNSPLFTLV